MAGWLVGGINPGLDWMGVCKQVDIRTTRQSKLARSVYKMDTTLYSVVCVEIHTCESVGRGQRRRFVGDYAREMS